MVTGLQEINRIREQAERHKEKFRALLRNLEDESILGLYNQVINLTNDYEELAREYNKSKAENERLKQEVKGLRDAIEKGRTPAEYARL